MQAIVFASNVKIHKEIKRKSPFVKSGIKVRNLDIIPFNNEYLAISDLLLSFEVSIKANVFSALSGLTHIRFSAESITDLSSILSQDGNSKTATALAIIHNINRKYIIVSFS